MEVSALGSQIPLVRSMSTPPMLGGGLPTDSVTLGVTSPYSPAVRPSGVAPVTPTVVSDEGASTQSSGARSFALGVLVALAVVGVAGYVVSQQGSAAQPTVSQSSVPAEVASDAMSDLRYLDEVGSKQGGGLFVDHFGIWQQRVSPNKAFAELAGGDSVHFKQSKDAVSHEIRSFQELDDLRDEVQVQQIKNGIKEGVREIQKGLEEIGRDLREGFREGMRN